MVERCSAYFLTLKAEIAFEAGRSYQKYYTVASRHPPILANATRRQWNQKRVSTDLNRNHRQYVQASR